MKLRTRLLGTFLACGLIPLVIFGFVNYVTANRSMNRIQQHAVADVSEKSGEKLIALRDIKKAQIEDYFNISVPLNSLPDLQTVSDLVMAITDLRSK